MIVPDLTIFQEIKRRLLTKITDIPIAPNIAEAPPKNFVIVSMVIKPVKTIGGNVHNFSLDMIVTPYCEHPDVSLLLKEKISKAMLDEKFSNGTELEVPTGEDVGKKLWLSKVTLDDNSMTSVITTQVQGVSRHASPARFTAAILER